MIPVIGLTTYREPVDRPGWHGQVCDLVPHDYSRALERVGAAVVLLPPATDAAVAAAATRRLDGLVVAGGADVNPARYGQRPGPEVTDWDDARDASELAHLAAADEAGLPVLGICRGMQLLAVAHGGVLHQHLPTMLRHDDHSGGQGTFSPIRVSPVAGTRLADVLSGADVTVSCHHHQGVAEHPGLVASAVAADGSLHAVEAPGDRFVVGVQWHPEAGDDLRLFEALVAAARDAAARR